MAEAPHHQIAEGVEMERRPEAQKNGGEKSGSEWKSTERQGVEGVFIERALPPCQDTLLHLYEREYRTVLRHVASFLPAEDQNVLTRSS